MVAIETFRSNKVRFALTALGMVIGTASLILVVTIGLTGKQYILREINAIGANMITANYEGGTIYGDASSNDFMTLDDLKAVRAEVSGIVAASPMIQLHDQIPVPGGKERDVLILGVSDEYQYVRNLVIPAGRFFDDYDTTARNKVAVITKQLAIRLFGSEDAAVGKSIKFNGLPFTIIGTFRERVETFGQSEISDDTILIPYTVARYFTDTDAVKNLFFSMSDSERVPEATKEIQAVLQSRHRPESVYNVENLTQLLDVAAKTANALTAVLLLISARDPGGERRRHHEHHAGDGELAHPRDRRAQSGGRHQPGDPPAVPHRSGADFAGRRPVGIVVGLALPFSLRFFTDYRVPISGLSVIIALVVSSMVGVLFGTVPATRAAQLDPVESLRYEYRNTMPEPKKKDEERERDHMLDHTLEETFPPAIRRPLTRRRCRSLVTTTTKKKEPENDALDPALDCERGRPGHRVLRRSRHSRGQRWHRVHRGARARHCECDYRTFPEGHHFPADGPDLWDFLVRHQRVHDRIRVAHREGLLCE